MEDCNTAKSYASKLKTSLPIEVIPEDQNDPQDSTDQFMSHSNTNLVNIVPENQSSLSLEST